MAEPAPAKKSIVPEKWEEFSGDRVIVDSSEDALEITGDQETLESLRLKPKVDGYS